MINQLWVNATVALEQVEAYNGSAWIIQLHNIETGELVTLLKRPNVHDGFRDHFWNHYKKVFECGTA